MKWLQAFFPQLTVAKLIAYAVAIAALLALLVFAWLTVKGWRDDSLALPLVTQQRDDARAAYANLDGHMTRRLDDFAGKLDANGKRFANADAAITGGQSTIDGEVAAFLRRFPHAPDGPACVEPQSLRDGLLSLFPVYFPAAQPGLAGGGSQGGGQAGSSAAAGAPAAMPGRQRSDNREGEMGMPTDTGRDAGIVAGPLGAASGDPDRRSAQGNEPALPAESVGLARRWYDRAADSVLAAMRFVGNAVVQTAQDDRRDGR